MVDKAEISQAVQTCDVHSEPRAQDISRRWRTNENVPACWLPPELLEPIFADIMQDMLPGMK